MIKVEVQGSKGVASYLEDTNKLGEMTFSLSPGMMIIDHTEVDPILKGQGVGLKLWHCVLDYARENELKIIALCPFAYKMFQRYPEHRHLLKVNDVA